MLQGLWTSREFGELLALNRIDPPIDRKLEAYQAQVAQIMANAFSDEEKPMPLGDFLIEFDRPPKTGEDLKQMARVITAAMGGTIE